MSFLGDIFGGREGTPGQVVDVTPPEFTALRGPLAAALQGAFTGSPALPTSGIPTQGGPNVAPLGGVEQQFLSQIQQLLGVGGGQASAGGGGRQIIGTRGDGSPIFGDAPSSGKQPRNPLTAPGTPGISATNPLSASVEGLLQQVLGGQFLSPGSNPSLQANIEAAQRPVREAFQEQVIPQLRSAFTQAGQTIQGDGSSPFGKALVQSSRDFQRNLGDISTRLVSENFARERGLQQGAVGQATAFSQGELQNLVTGLQTSALPRFIEQSGIEAGTQEFNNQLNLLLQVLSLASGAASPNTAVIQPTGGTAGADIGGLLTGGSDLIGALGGPAGIAALFAGGICWVAREVYGPDNPKWLLFREWMLTRAPKWLLAAYLKHGERIAHWLKGKDHLKNLIRGWMDTRVRGMA